MAVQHFRDDEALGDCGGQPGEYSPLQVRTSALSQEHQDDADHQRGLDPLT